MSLIQIKRVLGMKWRETGFSLIEILVAISLLVIAMSIATPAYLRYLHAGNINKVKVNSNVVKDQIGSCFQYARLYEDYTQTASDRLDKQFVVCNEMDELGLMPCIEAKGQAPINVSTACNTLSFDSTSKVLCVTVKWRKQNGCVRYDASKKKFEVCVDPENPGGCNTGCDPKKGYECSSGHQCVCA